MDDLQALNETGAGKRNPTIPQVSLPSGLRIQKNDSGVFIQVGKTKFYLKRKGQKGRITKKGIQQVLARIRRSTKKAKEAMKTLRGIAPPTTFEGVSSNLPGVSQEQQRIADLEREVRDRASREQGFASKVVELEGALARKEAQEVKARIGKVFDDYIGGLGYDQLGNLLLNGLKIKPAKSEKARRQQINTLKNRTVELLFEKKNSTPEDLTSALLQASAEQNRFTLNVARTMSGNRVVDGSESENESPARGRPSSRIPVNVDASTSPAQQERADMGTSPFVQRTPLREGALMGASPAIGARNLALRAERRDREAEAEAVLEPEPPASGAPIRPSDPAPVIEVRLVQPSAPPERLMFDQGVQSSPRPQPPPPPPPELVRAPPPPPPPQPKPSPSPLEAMEESKQIVNDINFEVRRRRSLDPKVSYSAVAKDFRELPEAERQAIRRDRLQEKAQKSVARGSLPDILSGEQVLGLGKMVDPYFTTISYQDQIADTLKPLFEAGTLPPRISMVYNTLTSDGSDPQEHYVALVFDQKKRRVYVFDPLGEDVSPIVMEQITKLLDMTPFRYKVKFNSVVTQDRDSSNCGHHALAFIDRIAKGDDFATASLYNKVDGTEKGEKSAIRLKKKLEFLTK